MRACGLLISAASSIYFARAETLAPKAVTSEAISPVSHLFVFGDSYSTTGFHAKDDALPSVENPLGNPAYPGKTFSGGANWVDTVVYNSSFEGLLCYNFAWGRNTVNNTQVERGNFPFPPDEQYPKDLIDQNAEFEALIDVPWTSERSVFVHWFGINDVALQVFNARYLSTGEGILRPSVDCYFGLLGRQYEHGARKFILLLVPPIHRTFAWGYGDNPKAAQVESLVGFWNDLLDMGATTFRRQFPEAKLIVVDPTMTFDHILSNPEQYGAPPDAAHCTNLAGEPCLWHDFIHPGLVIQQEIGLMLANTIRDVFS